MRLNTVFHSESNEQDGTRTSQNRKSTTKTVLNKVTITIVRVNGIVTVCCWWICYHDTSFVPHWLTKIYVYIMVSNTSTFAYANNQVIL